MIWNKCDNQQLWKCCWAVRGCICFTCFSISYAFPSKLKEVPNSAPCAAVRELFSLFSTELRACDKTSTITNARRKSKWIKNAPKILSTIQVASEESCLQYCKQLELVFSKIWFSFLYFYVDVFLLARDATVNNSVKLLDHREGLLPSREGEGIHHLEQRGCEKPSISSKSQCCFWEIALSQGVGRCKERKGRISP